MEKISSDQLERESKSLCKFRAMVSLTRLILASLCIVPLARDSTCGDDMKNIFIGSAVTLYYEAFLFLAYQIVFKGLEKCKLFCPCFKIISTVYFILFYLGWGIYIAYVYTDQNDCDYGSSFADGLALTLVIYYWTSLTFKLCCFTCFMCACLSAILAISSVEKEAKNAYERIQDEPEGEKENIEIAQTP